MSGATISLAPLVVLDWVLTSVVVRVGEGKSCGVVGSTLPVVALRTVRAFAEGTSIVGRTLARSGLGVLRSSVWGSGGSRMPSSRGSIMRWLDGTGLRSVKTSGGGVWEGLLTSDDSD